MSRTESGMASATEVQQRGACPQCGARLPDVPVSLCPYCATPLASKATEEGRASIHAARIARVADHRDTAEAMLWSPPEGPLHQRGRRRTWWGTRSIVAGALVAAASFVSGGVGVAAVAGLTVLAFGVWIFLAGRKDLQDAVRFPLMRRPALILDRRSETRIRGWSGDTIYYFKLEFGDGAQGEFRYPGLGPQEEPYSTNLPGIAYTRGQALLHFRHIRV